MILYLPTVTLLPQWALNSDFASVPDLNSEKHRMTVYAATEKSAEWMLAAIIMLLMRTA